MKLLTGIAREIETKRVSLMCPQEKIALFRRELRGVVDHLVLREEMPLSILTRLTSLVIEREIAKYSASRL